MRSKKFVKKLRKFITTSRGLDSRLYEVATQSNEALLAAVQSVLMSSHSSHPVYSSLQLDEMTESARAGMSHFYALACAESLDDEKSAVWEVFLRGKQLYGKPRDSRIGIVTMNLQTSDPARFSWHSDDPKISGDGHILLKSAVRTLTNLHRESKRMSGSNPQPTVEEKQS